MYFQNDSQKKKKSYLKCQMKERENIGIEISVVSFNKKQWIRVFLKLMLTSKFLAIVFGGKKGQGKI